MPAKAGIQDHSAGLPILWIPAFAGMTTVEHGYEYILGLK